MVSGFPMIVNTQQYNAGVNNTKLIYINIKKREDCLFIYL